MDITLSISQLAKLIAVNGADKTYVVRGPMGSGKSSIVGLLQKRFGDKYHCVTVDCTQLDIGDLQVPDVDKVAGVVRYVPNIMFIGDGTKPVVINFDEIGKASRSVQNAILPVLLERRIGMRPLPEGSIVFCTSNLGAENVGDMFQPHARNRVSFVEMRHPTVREWMPWADANGVPISVQAWVEMNPDVFMSFKECPDPKDESKFPYGYHPKFQRESFLTPRSLYLASIELRDDRRQAIDDIDVTTAAVCGNVGIKAGMELMAHVALADKLPKRSEVITSPDTAPLYEESPAAMVQTAISCAKWADKANLSAVITYVKRMPTEIQHLFSQRIMTSDKAAWAVENMAFTHWVRANHWAMKA